MAVSASNTRWRSDGFEFCREDGARLLVTFVLECCDREAIGWVARQGNRMKATQVREVQRDRYRRWMQPGGGS